ncbi:Retrovirus-related Pol polyprotein from transposon 17.6, partial [Mucuna pruriens]
MDDFTVYANSFDACLEILSKVLTRCIDTNLVLNFEKCHFMVTEGIVLEHLVPNRGIKVDKLKIDIINSLPNPISVQVVCSFLGHVGFYIRFIKNFKKIALPLSKLLQKDVGFKFDQHSVEAFRELKNRLTSAPIFLAPNWDYPFELMCDASNSALGADLGQRARVDKQVHVIANASGPDLEFNIKIKDKKGAENLVADHLSRIERESDSMPIRDEFLDEQLLHINTASPWFANIYNFVAISQLPPKAS